MKTALLFSLPASIFLSFPLLSEGQEGTHPALTLPAPGGEAAVSESPPPFDIEATGAVLEEAVIEGVPFTYELSLSWEGDPGWVALSSPEVDWPEGLDLENVGQRTRSVPGETGPRGTKSIKYRLIPRKRGPLELPDVRIELTRLGSDPESILVTGSSVEVQARKIPSSERLQALLRENWIILSLVTFLVVVTVTVSLLARRRPTESEAEPPDPWQEWEEKLKAADALRLAGETRDYYGKVETLVHEGISIARGGNDTGPGDPTEEGWIPEATAQDLRDILQQAKEGKYRPDRPRADDLERYHKRLRTALYSLKKTPSRES